ncbi:MAG: hypothetical protein NUV59_01055 [Patescibacteria group bacterium]|nr:hypothetical protein [Patescibacteria group bacterium]
MDKKSVAARYAAHFGDILPDLPGHKTKGRQAAVAARIHAYAANVLPDLLMSRDEARQRAEKYEEADDDI